MVGGAEVFPTADQESEMSIAIDLIETTRGQSLLDRPLTDTRPKRKRPSAAEVKRPVVRSAQPSATQSSSELAPLALQLVCTFTMTAVCVVAFAYSAWMLLDVADSALDHLFRLSPNQLLQGLAGR
jgi:hypothetical protein